MAAQKPKVRSDLTVVELEGEAVIYDDQTRQVHYLNQTATIVLNLFDGSSTIKEISGDIADAFSLRQDEVERQVRTLLRSFREAGFMEGSRSRPASSQVGNSAISSNGKVSRAATPKGNRRLTKRGKRS
jgi:vesicle coat complex subunit